MKPIQVFSVWSYDTTLEHPLVTRFTTTCNQHTAEERALWDYAQLQRGRTVTVPAHLTDLDHLALVDDVTITERAAHIARLIDRLTEDDDGTQ